MEKQIKQVPTQEIKSEDGADELLSSPDMHPYVSLMMTGLADGDIEPHLKQIAQLPLEKRYVWRVASALKNGFADFDSVNVEVDRQTLSPDDLQNVAELLRLRPMQFCIFLKTLFGPDAMERMMQAGIAAAKAES